MPKNKHLIKIMIFTVAAIMISSCDRKTIFHKYNHTDINGWEKTDTLNYNIDRINKSGNYKEEIGFRLNGTYPFTGLSVIVEQTILPTNSTTYDTLSCNFGRMQDKYDSNGVSYRQFKFHLKSINLNEGDSLILRIRHNMIKEILPGISDVGVKISETQTI